MRDELGSDNAFESFLNTHLMKNSIGKLLHNENAVWWDDTNTPEKETCSQICARAYNTTIDELVKQLGKNPNDWQWGRVHTLEHVNAVGRKKPLNEFFNIGPMAAPGGMETLNNSGFSLNAKGLYPATFGPAMRILIDFADPENSLSINPTGQSGVFSSKHYDDQALLYINCKYRKQMMNKEEVMHTCKNKLVLKP
jgi:penicillin amidase